MELTAAETAQDSHLIPFKAYMALIPLQRQMYMLILIPQNCLMNSRSYCATYLRQQEAETSTELEYCLVL
jgi:hypothetical protein